MSAPASSIVDKIVALHDALHDAALPHAFGGALALAWCTERARGTIDIDLNVFIDSSRSAQVFEALPAEVQRDAEDLAHCIRDGQVRLWWDATPIDLFTNNTDFHDDAAARAILHEFASVDMPFLACTDVAVFKAFFNRPKDWVDVGEMIRAKTLDVDTTLGLLVRHLGAGDERVNRLAELARGGP